MGLVDDSRPERVAGVGGDRPHLLLLAVQRLGVELRLRHPEGLVEAPAEQPGLGLEPVGGLGLAARPEDPRQARLSPVDVALDLDQRRRHWREPAVEGGERVG